MYNPQKDIGKLRLPLKKSPKKLFLSNSELFLTLKLPAYATYATTLFSSEIFKMKNQRRERRKNGFHKIV